MCRFGPLHETEGERIGRLRRRVGLRTKELGTALGVCGATVSDWEADRLGRSAETERRLARVLGVSVSYLRAGDSHHPTGRLAGVGAPTGQAAGGAGVLLRSWQGVLEELRAATDSRLALRAISQIASDAPLPSVRSLASAVYVSDDALRYHWHREFPRVGLKRLLSWRLLVYCASYSGEVGHRLARRMGVHRRTLERSSVRLTGRELAKVGRNPDLARQELERWWGEALGGGS